MNVAQLESTSAVVLGALWRASWQAAVIAVLVLAVQFIFRERLPARWKHNLWLLVLIRLAIPVTPAAPFSVFNLAKHLPQTPTVIPVAPRIEIGQPVEAPAAVVVTPAKTRINWMM